MGQSDSLISPQAAAEAALTLTLPLCINRLQRAVTAVRMNGAARVWKEIK